MSKHKGVHTHRFRENPEEERFAEAWDKHNSKPSIGFLETLLCCGSHGRTLDSPPVLEDRDRVVAATVVQWLGSPVGQSFLRDLGYERAEPRNVEILWAAMTAMVKDIHAPQDQLTKAQWKVVVAMANKVGNSIVNDAGHVSDIVEIEGSPARASGVRHELVQDGLSVRVREVWYWVDTGEERAVDEVRMPINDLIHLIVNTTPGERFHLSNGRSTVPASDWIDVPHATE